MKSIISLIAFVAIVFGNSSCEKKSIFFGDEKDTEIKKINSFTFEEKKTELKWAGYYLSSDDSGYVFTLSADTLDSNPRKQINAFSIDLPVEQLGKKSYLNTDLNGANWSFYGIFKDEKKSYMFYSNFSDDEDWVQVTKNSNQAHNFTIEFAITLENKRLTGSYTGNFKQYNDSKYLDIYP